MLLYPCSSVPHPWLISFLNVAEAPEVDSLRIDLAALDAAVLEVFDLIADAVSGALAAAVVEADALAVFLDPVEEDDAVAALAAPELHEVAGARFVGRDLLADPEVSERDGALLLADV